MAARTFFVGIKNTTLATMRRVDAGLRLYHGVWSANGIPREVVGPNAEDWFQAESDGFMTGAEGLVTYTLEHPFLEAESLYIRFNNPYWGGNDFTATSSHADSSYRLIWGDPGGDHARIDLVIRLTASASSSTECNLGALWGDTDEAFAQMRQFRDSGIADYPGLDDWWFELQECIPALVSQAREDEQLRDAVDALMGAVPSYLSNPQRAIERTHVEAARLILTRLAGSRPELSIRFAERGFRVLTVLEGRPWAEALEILSSVRPGANT